MPSADSENVDVDVDAPASSTTPAQPTKPTQPLSQIDLEWAQFERDVLAPRAAPLNGDDIPLSKKEIYDRATVVMEEEVRYDGFPGDADQSTLGTVVGAGGVVGEYVGGPPPPAEEKPEETVARKALEEKELIMDRILDEERAQEDADEKVRAIKARLAAVRRKREEAKKKAAGS